MLTCNPVHHIIISTHSLTRRLTTNRNFYRLSTRYFNSQPHKEADLVRCQEFGNKRDFNSQPHKEADGESMSSSPDIIISTHSLTRRLTFINSVTVEQYKISTHSLTRRLTAILFNKNRFVQFIFITLYQSPPQPLLLPPFFHPIFSFSARISGANRPRIGWGLGVRTIGSGYR